MTQQEALQEARMNKAMISHLGDGDWHEIELAQAEKLVTDRKAYRCPICDDTAEDRPYEDGMPSFHYDEASFADADSKERA